MATTLYRRLLRDALVVTTGAAVLVGAGMYVLAVHETRTAVVERLRAELDLVADRIAGRADDTAFERDVRRWAEQLGVRLVLLDAERRVLADSHGGATGTILGGRPAPELDAALELGWGVARHRSPSSGVAYLFVARRVGGESAVRYVRAAIPLQQVVPRARPLAAVAVGLGLVAVLAMTGLALVLLRRRLRSFETAIDGARALAAGRLADPLPGAAEARPDELPALLERARRRLRRRLRRVEHRYRDLAAVVAGMKESLLIVDGDRRVEMVNQAFRDTFRPGIDPEGRPLVEVLRDPGAIAVIEDVIERGEARRELLRHSAPIQRAWELIVYPLPGRRSGTAAGAVALLLDVTRLERLEQTRRDFVANVSHELRTPLTSLKAAAMTLVEGAADDPKARERFLTAIVRQVDRMSALVSDLGDLSRIETGAIRLTLEDVDVRSLVGDVVAQIAPRRDDVTVGVDVPDGFAVRADRGRLEQILANLIDNAIKFNRPGGTVTVRGFRREDGRPTIVVEDTGIGIAADDRDKVFGRFYRVDASRSRALGGTGLGLAIVKHLMALHGGRVRLESELGRGSRFLLEF